MDGEVSHKAIEVHSSGDESLKSMFPGLRTFVGATGGILCIVLVTAGWMVWQSEFVGAMGAWGLAIPIGHVAVAIFVLFATYFVLWGNWQKTIPDRTIIDTDKNISLRWHLNKGAALFALVVGVPVGLFFVYQGFQTLPWIGYWTLIFPSMFIWGAGGVYLGAKRGEYIQRTQRVA